MNKFYLLSAILFIAGLLLILFYGDVKGGFFLIFPFIVGSGLHSALGIFLIFLSFLFFALGMMERVKEEMTGHSEISGEEEFAEKKIEGGGVVFIGPFPVIFGTSLKAVQGLIIIAIILMILTMLFIFWSLLLT
ncbi:MAG: DUF131 domain-containing protein [Thermoplasmata archaeon]|nr:MAG: DUF131 domain-containing protein [Thermoplasmata archaeon]KAA0013962.1 MAG: DUF131 domain-containing protein [Thermoplasmata archaeon]